MITRLFWGLLIIIIDLSNYLCFFAGALPFPLLGFLVLNHRIMGLNNYLYYFWGSLFFYLFLLGPKTRVYFLY